MSFGERARLGEANARSGRLAEHRRRDQVVMDRRRSIAEQRVGDGVAFADRDGCQRHAAGRVADCIDVRHARA
jgi:hypothetical protein